MDTPISRSRNSSGWQRSGCFFSASAGCSSRAADPNEAGRLIIVARAVSWAAGTLILQLLPSLIQAQVPVERFKKVVVPGEVRQAAGRLAAVDDLVRRSKWAEALDEY